MHLRAGHKLSWGSSRPNLRPRPRVVTMQAVGSVGSAVLVGSAGQQLYYERIAPDTSKHQGPAVLLLNGLLSDTTGRKAVMLKEMGQDLGAEVVVFDYRAHGASPGVFQQLGVGDWLLDSIDILESVVTSKQVVVVGSSLGGWLALLLASRRPQRVSALVLVAPAVDISELHWQGLKADVRAAALQSGLVPLHSPYVSTTPGPDQPGPAGPANDSAHDAPVTAVIPQQGTVMLGLQFFIQGSQLLLMHKDSAFMAEYTAGEAGPPALRLSLSFMHDKPLAILHGADDNVVPVAVSHSLLKSLAEVAEGHVEQGCQVQRAIAEENTGICEYQTFHVVSPSRGCVQQVLHVVMRGDHRLSADAELAVLRTTVQGLLKGQSKC